MRWGALLILLLKFSLEASWDSEFWQTLNWTQYQSSKIRVYSMGQIRFNHAMKIPNFYQISENFAYTDLPFLDLELHYNYLNDKNRGAKTFTNRSRIDFEINPHVTLKNGIFLRSRNRLELIKVQNDSKLRTVFRELLQITFPIECQGMLNQITLSNEIFYNFTYHKITQNRFIPIQLSYQLTSDLTWNPALMIRNFFTSAKWYRSIVIVSDFGF